MILEKQQDKLLPCSYPVFRFSFRCAPPKATERHKGKRHDYLQAGQRGLSRRWHQRYERQICSLEPTVGRPVRHDPQRVWIPSMSSLAGGYCDQGLRQIDTAGHLTVVSRVFEASMRTSKLQTDLNIPCIGGGPRDSRAVPKIRYNCKAR